MSYFVNINQHLHIAQPKDPHLYADDYILTILVKNK